jgi:ABC-type transport system substrate-binding protein
LSWLSYFVSRTDTLCSNYESEAMDALFEQVATTADPAERLELYAQIQTLWSAEFPTLSLTQEARYAVSLPKVIDLGIDPLGLMHYGAIVKTGE